VVYDIYDIGLRPSGAPQEVCLVRLGGAMIGAAEAVTRSGNCRQAVRALSRRLTGLGRNLPAGGPD
jgi:hypothetical protein